MNVCLQVDSPSAHSVVYPQATELVAYCCRWATGERDAEIVRQRCMLADQSYYIVRQGTFSQMDRRIWQDQFELEICKRGVKQRMRYPCKLVGISGWQEQM